MMANNNSDDTNHVLNFPPFPSPSTPSPSLPLHLSGFLSGDTVQVQGDTGDLQFSVQFNVSRKERNPEEPFNFPDSNIPETETVPCSFIQSASSSSYLTPYDQDQNVDADHYQGSEVSWSRDVIVTRLRSGVLSPVKYNIVQSYALPRGGLSSRKKRSRGKAENAFEKMLKRRSLPLRPCSSYAFFVMANWGVVKSPSFEETSKRLGRRWRKLNDEMKKEYEDMALKDNARYRRQCAVLRNHDEEFLAEANSE